MTVSTIRRIYAPLGCEVPEWYEILLAYKLEGSDLVRKLEAYEVCWDH